MHRRSTEPERRLDQLHRNRIRLEAWRQRYRLATGREPVITITLPRSRHLHAVRPAAQIDAVGNQNVVKMAAYKRQYMHASLPTIPGPDAA